MKDRHSQYIKVQGVKLRQGAIGLHDRLGPIADAVVVLLIGGVFVSLMVRYKLGSASDWAGVLGAFATTAICVYLLKRAARQHHILIEVTMSYLVHGGKQFLDDLLGKMIGGKWHREQLRPGDALFDVLETVARSQDYEMKRRVVEALPSLGNVDTKRTMEIARILRGDWDDRWHSDLRRRAVEALVVPPLPGEVPLLLRAKRDVVAEFLQLRDKDQVYVGFAIAEALQEWEDTAPKLAPRLWSELIEFSARMHSPEETQAIGELVGLLTTVRTKSAVEVVDQIVQMSQHKNTFVRVVAARNILRIASRLPEQVLFLMERFLDSAQPKNVRRPISREQSIQFLIQELSNRALGPRARQLLMKLIADPDEIIRTTTFDKAELLRIQAPDVFLEVCQYIIRNEPSQTLRDRAHRAYEEYVATQSQPN